LKQRLPTYKKPSPLWIKNLKILQQHIAIMKTMQANKATQDNYTHKLENITKQLGYLVDQMLQLIGKPFDPMLRNGIG